MFYFSPLRSIWFIPGIFSEAHSTLKKVHSRPAVIQRLFSEGRMTLTHTNSFSKVGIETVEKVLAVRTQGENIRRRTLGGTARIFLTEDETTSTFDPSQA